jgi:uncharacterized membrane protein YidH (DUF202 family)
LSASTRLGPGHLARLALADMRERMRRPGYLVSLLVMVWIGQGMLPPAGAGYRTFVIHGEYRPVYDAAWVGALTATLTGVFFQLIGFYIVRGTIERDRRNGVGQIVAASRVGRFAYLASKALSHFLVLMSMAVVVIGAALVMQQVRGEDRTLDFIATVTPFVCIALPVAAMVAAGAVLFDSVPLLRGGLGNVAWFFLLAAFMGGAQLQNRDASPYGDLFAAGIVGNAASAACEREFPAAASGTPGFSMGVNINPRWKGVPVRTYAWDGIDWSGHRGASRVMWLLLALGVVGLATLPFDRFEHTRNVLGARRVGLPFRARPAPEVTAAAFTLPRGVAAMTPARGGAQPWALVAAEWALMVRGQGWWWYAGALGLLIAGMFAPLTAVRSAILPLASFWPVFVWSALGVRERRDQVAPLVFSCPRPVPRLVPAAWVAGALIALVTGITGVARLALAGQWGAVGGWMLCAWLAPVLAFACGVWSGQSRLFEVVWLFLWYIGPMNRVAPLDYTGVVVARDTATWVAYFAATAALKGFGLLGRARQLQR